MSQVSPYWLKTWTYQKQGLEIQRMGRPVVSEEPQRTRKKPSSLAKGIVLPSSFDFDSASEPSAAYDGIP